MDNAGEGPPEETVEESHQDRPLLLIADDDEDLLAVTAVTARIEGFDVVTAADGQEAWEVARSTRPDMAVLDIMMPHVDGLEVCRRLRKDPQTRDMVIVIFTAGLEETMVEALQAGANGFMRKPFDPDELIEYLKWVAEH